MTRRLDLRIDAPVGAAVQVGTIQIAAAALPPGGGPPAELPPRPALLAGREPELAAITRGATGPVRAALVTGAPGSGRTALALEAAHRLAPLFPDGVLVDGLRGRRLGPDDLAARLLTGLGLPVPARAPRVALQRELVRRRILVVLDDLDDLDPDRRTGITLVPQDSRSFLVITAASGRGMPHGLMRRIRLGGLSPDAARLVLGLPAPGDPGALGDRAAAGGRGGPGGGGPGGDALVAACGGLPLALRIAAARLASEPGLTPAGLASRLTPDRLLDELRIGERGLRDSLGAAYTRLRPAEQRLLRAFGTVPAGRAMTAATAAAASGAGVRQARETLAVLADSHLLDAVRGGYVAPLPVRCFAGELVQDGGYQASKGRVVGSAAPSWPSRASRESSASNPSVSDGAPSGPAALSGEVSGSGSSGTVGPLGAGTGHDRRDQAG